MIPASSIGSSARSAPASAPYTYKAQHFNKTFAIITFHALLPVEALLREARDQLEASEWPKLKRWSDCIIKKSQTIYRIVCLTYPNPLARPLLPSSVERWHDKRHRVGTRRVTTLKNIRKVHLYWIIYGERCLKRQTLKSNSLKEQNSEKTKTKYIINSTKK